MTQVLEGAGLQSLLDSVSEKRQFKHIGCILTRATIIVNSSPVDDKTTFLEQLGSYCQSKSFQHKVTGLCLMYPKYSQLCLEVASFELIKVLQHLNELLQKGVIQEAKLLHAGDATRRRYKSFVSSVLQLSNVKVVDYLTSDPVENTAVECVTQNHKIAEVLFGVPSSDQSKTLSQLHESHPELLSSQGMLRYLLAQPDLDSLQDYMDRQESPPNFLPHSEYTWPLPTRLFPYE